MDGVVGIRWTVGVTSNGEVYATFSDGKEQFRFSCDGSTAVKIGEAMKDAASLAGKKVSQTTN